MKKFGLAITLLATLAGCETQPRQSASDIESMKQQLLSVQKTRRAEKANLENFDDLHFNVYSGQKWEQFARSHSKDIVVHNSDDSITRGLDPHIEQLKQMFVFAPDTRIREHPIKIASGDWTLCKESSRAPSRSRCQSETGRRSLLPGRLSGLRW